MRLLSGLLVLLLPAATAAQTADEKTATLNYIQSLRDPQTGAYKVTPDGKPSLRACNGAVRAIKYLGGQPPEPEKTAAFVLSCYDPKTGEFAEPDVKPDVAITSIGIMAAVELGVPKEKYAKAVEYLRTNAKTFDDVRIGAAALEALNERPGWLGEWFKIADAQLRDDGLAGEGDGIARETASVIAMKLRLGVPRRELKNSNQLDDVLQAGQWPDGGYGRAGEKRSDLESTYRVMRAFVLMRERPKQRAEMRAFVLSCRNADGGFSVAPGAPSSMSGVYYAATILKWLDDMER
jgi:prenyltransferase beta subunit